MKIGTAATAAAFKEILGSDSVAIILATPLEERATQAVAAIEHGKAVFSHKPLAMDGDDTQLVVDVARGNCLLLGIDLPHRYDPALASIAPAQSVSITLADQNLLYDALDIAVLALRSPRIVRVTPARVELAGGRAIEIQNGATNSVTIDGKTITLNGANAGRALSAFQDRLAISTDFDETIESVVDAARILDQLHSRIGT